jgi:hypothetical protein
MKWFMIIQKLNKFTQAFLIIGIIFLIYGYLCRSIGIYFFWESKSFGWFITFIGLIGFLFARIKIRKKEAKKSIFEKIVMGILIFILAIQIILVVVLPNTAAYQYAKQFLLDSQNIRAEIGNIKGFSIIPLGVVSVSSGEWGETGNAEINLTVKGEKKFLDVTIYLTKEVDSTWKVNDMK